VKSFFVHNKDWNKNGGFTDYFSDIICLLFYNLLQKAVFSMVVVHLISDMHLPVMALTLNARLSGLKRHMCVLGDQILPRKCQQCYSCVGFRFFSYFKQKNVFSSFKKNKKEVFCAFRVFLLFQAKICIFMVKIK